MRLGIRNVAMSAVLAVGLGGCAGGASMELGEGDASAEGAATRPRRVHPISGTHVTNLSRSGNFYFSGKPSMEGLERLEARGVAAVINLRSKQEMQGIPERRTVQGLGMAYYRVPISGPQSLTDAKLDKARRLLRRHQKEPTLIHCASGNRVGAVWLAYRVLDEGASWEAALEEAKAIGLHTDAYRRRVKQYIRQRRRG